MRVDVFVKRGNEIELSEVKAKGFDPSNQSFRSAQSAVTSEWRPYLYDVAFQFLVLNRCHPEWKVTPFLLLLDTSSPASVDRAGAQFRIERKDGRVEVTVREGFDARSLEPPLLRAHDVTDEVHALTTSPVARVAESIGVDAFVDSLSETIAASKPFDPNPGSHCKRCEFYCAPEDRLETRRSGWAECMEAQFKRDIHVPRKDTVFGLYGFRRIDQFLHKGHLSLKGVSEEDLDVMDESGEITTSRRQFLQIAESRSIGDDIWLEEQSLSDTLDQWSFPLHFVDFETSRPAIPFHRGHRPYELLLFQFSHHVLEADGALRHTNQCLFVESGTPPSSQAVRALRSALSTDKGTVVALVGSRKDCAQGDQGTHSGQR